MEAQDQKFYDILLEIKNDLGAFKAQLGNHQDVHRDIKKLLEAHDERMNGHAEKIGELVDFKKGLKIRVGTVTTLLAIITSAGFDTIKRWLLS